MYLYILYNVYYIIILYPLIPQYFPNNLFCKCIFLEKIIALPMPTPVSVTLEVSVYVI